MLKKTCVVLATFSLLAVCLSAGIVKRMVNGQNVINVDFYSFTVNIRRESRAVCNGVLVGKKWILTLKNCIDENSLDEYKVYFRSKANIEESGLVRTIKKVVALGGPASQIISNEDDGLILVKLNKNIQPNTDNIRPLEEFSSGRNEGNIEWCKAIAFSQNGRAYNKLYINIISTKKCTGYEDAKTLCFTAGQGKLCQEDNGSPVVCKYNNTRYLVGLSSVTGGCKEENIKGVRLSFFRDSLLEANYQLRKKPVKLYKPTFGEENRKERIRECIY